MFKPNDYDLDSEYRQRQMLRSERARQARAVNADKESFFARSVRAALSIISRLFTTQEKQPPADTMQHEVNRRIYEA